MVDTYKRATYSDKGEQEKEEKEEKGSATEEEKKGYSNL